MIEISVLSENEQVTELWDNERWENEQLQKLVMSFTEIAKQISHGKLQY